MTNKALVQKFYDDVFNKWDVSNIDEYMHDDYRQHNAKVEDGKAGFLKFCEKFLALKPKVDIYYLLSNETKSVCFLNARSV